MTPKEEWVASVGREDGEAQTVSCVPLLHILGPQHRVPVPGGLKRPCMLSAQAPPPESHRACSWPLCLCTCCQSHPVPARILLLSAAVTPSGMLSWKLYQGGRKPSSFSGAGQ